MECICFSTFELKDSSGPPFLAGCPKLLIGIDLKTGGATLAPKRQSWLWISMDAMAICTSGLTDAPLPVRNQVFLQHVQKVHLVFLFLNLEIDQCVPQLKFRVQLCTAFRREIHPFSTAQFNLPNAFRFQNLYLQGSIGQTLTVATNIKTSRNLNPKTFKILFSACVKGSQKTFSTLPPEISNLTLKAEPDRR